MRVSKAHASNAGDKRRGTQRLHEKRTQRLSLTIAMNAARAKLELRRSDVSVATDA